jgi:pimeloyl-ACP methyl ester carboxylesterase
MDALGIGQAHLVGNSAGNSAGFAIAMDHPERALSWTASGGEPRGVTPDALEHAFQGQSTRLQFVREFLAQPVPDLEGMKTATAAFFYNQGHPRIPDVAEMRLASLLRPHVLEKEREHAQDQIENKRYNLTEPSVFQRLKVPAYLIHGRDEPGFFSDADRPAMLGATMQPVADIPNGDLTILAHCGHWPQIEMSERYNGLLLTFLRSLRRD